MCNLPVSRLKSPGVSSAYLDQASTSINSTVYLCGQQRDCHSCTWDYDYIPHTSDPLVRHHYVSLTLTLSALLELWILLRCHQGGASVGEVCALDQE